MKRMPPNLWEMIMFARTYLHVAPCILLAENGVSEEVMRQICLDLVAEDDAVRGNRHRESEPTWEDARLCFRKTLTFAIAMMDEIEKQKA